jgi:hypothetical protein
MSLFSESIARKMRLVANKKLAERYARRKSRQTTIESRKGKVVKVARRSNGLLDD